MFKLERWWRTLCVVHLSFGFGFFPFAREVDFDFVCDALFLSLCNYR